MILTQEHINAFLRDFQEEHEYNTVRSVHLTTGMFLRWLDGRDMNRQTICQFVRDTILPRRAGTAFQYQARLYWFLSWMVKQRLISEVPFQPMRLNTPWVPTRREVFTDKDYQRLVQKALLCRDPVHRRGKRSDGGWRHYAIVTAWNTGLRFVDVCYLRQENIFWHNKPCPIIRLVPQKTRKKGIEVNIPIRDELAECLRCYISKFGESYVHPPLAAKYSRFGNHDNYFAVSWRQFFDSLNLYDHTFHCLRHTFVSRILNRGHQIQTVSGMTGQGYRTLQLYNHPSLEVAREALDDSLSAGDPPAPTLDGTQPNNTHAPAELLH